MGRKTTASEHTSWASLTLLLTALLSCTVAYIFASLVLRPKNWSSISEHWSKATIGDDPNGSLEGERGECCRGIQNLELWGTAVKWGSEFKLNSSQECCEACKAMCSSVDGLCLCDTWVFCGNREACGPRYGECWLKKQKDTLAPERQASGENVIWTSGLIFGKGEGVIGLETQYGTLHIKLLPDCSPCSVAYILELLALRHCVGCHFYRAEGRGQLWDSVGNHIDDASFGPPFALIQGTLGAQGSGFEEIPTEFCPTIRRGSVGWVGSGPEFFISLANHHEWRKAYTVFGSVFPEDMDIAENISRLPTKSDVWGNINVAVLETPVRLRIQKSNLKVNEEAV
ncbi:Peptidylprolyl isomerase [Bertholletia excelsa]